MRNKAIGAVGAIAVVLTLFGTLNGASAQPIITCVPRDTPPTVCIDSESGNIEVGVIANGQDEVVFGAGRSGVGGSVFIGPNGYGAALYCDSQTHTWHLGSLVGMQFRNKDLGQHCNG